MGESADRGIDQQSSTDNARDLWTAINQMADQIVSLIPYYGAKSGTTDASGYATITHGFGFTPRLVTVTNIDGNLTTHACIPAFTDSYTATTFRVRFLWLVASGASYLVDVPVTKAYSIRFSGIR